MKHALTLCDVAEAAAHGFDAVELILPGPATYHVREILDLAERHQLAIAAVGTGAGMLKHGLTLTDPSATCRTEALDFVKSHITSVIPLIATGLEADLKRVREAKDGQFADVIIDATGILSFPHAPLLHRRELTLLASRNALPADFPEIIRLIANKKIRTDPWITHRLAFDEVPERFENFTNPSLSAIKAVITVHP
jgi:hypothetical protein